MTLEQSPEQTSADQAAAPTPLAEPSSSPEPAPGAKAAVPAFNFPFSPSAFAPGKNDGQPWHQKGNKSAHEKKIGPAPNGTRRSMGKR
jgi:hypothetical protein